jgi:cytochrome c oxidase subunit 2
MNIKRSLATSFVLLAAAAPVLAQGDAAAGQSAYGLCAACHGANGEGNKAMNAPAIAGQSEAYVTRQLTNFRAGLRGTAAGDTFGMQMRPMSMAIGTDAQVANVSAYVASMDVNAEAHDGGGDAAAGRGQYAVCASCHGQNGEGNEALGGPRLNILPDWYIIRQVSSFKAGTRGSAAGDTFGAQMRGMAMTVANDAAAANVAAYIATLGN